MKKKKKLKNEKKNESCMAYDFGSKIVLIPSKFLVEVDFG